MKTLLVSAAAVLLTSGAAMAADLSTPYVDNTAPAYAAPYDWSGYYVGLVGGYTWADADYSTGISPDLEGLTLGGTLGANWQMDSFVLGLEGDVSWSGADEDYAAGSIDQDYVATIRARAGYAIDDVLLYATGGLAISDFTLNEGAGDQSETFYGWTIGAGAEYALTDALSAKVEYLYTDYNDEGVGGYTVDPDSHAVRVGLNYKF